MNIHSTPSHVNSKIRICHYNETRHEWTEQDETEYDVTFIDNFSLDKTSLNVSKLHLNAKGSFHLSNTFYKLHQGRSIIKTFTQTVQIGFSNGHHKPAAGTVKASFEHESLASMLNMPLFGCSSRSGMTIMEVLFQKGKKFIYS